MAQLLCKNTKGIYYMLWGGKQHDIWTKSVHDDHIDYTNQTYDGFRLLDMRQFQFEYYKRNIKNLHHVTLNSYIRIVYPYLSDILHFPYNRNDFEVYPLIGDDMDCSFLWFKKDMKWTISINQKIVAEHEGFKCLTNIDKTFPGSTETTYHCVFSSSHNSCHIINESLPEGETIAITGDSYMIPVIPILACYYKEVVFLDNRFGGESNKDYFENKIFDKIIVACSENNPPIKYLGYNLS